MSSEQHWQLSKYAPLVRLRRYWHGTFWFDVLYESYVVLPHA